MNKIFLVVSLSMFSSGCVAPENMTDIVGGFTTSLVGGTASAKPVKTVSISELTTKVGAFDSGYGLIELRGGLESDAQKEILLSYINGVKGKLDELELEKESITGQQNVAVRGKVQRSVLGGDSKAEQALGRFSDKLDSLKVMGDNNRLQKIQSDIFLAKKLLIRTKAMIQ